MLHSPKLTENESHETSDEILCFCIDVFKISRQKLANQIILFMLRALIKLRKNQIICKFNYRQTGARGARCIISWRFFWEKVGNFGSKIGDFDKYVSGNTGARKSVTRPVKKCQQ